jgi:cytochrome c-type biogenesis protein CcmH/NrfF
MSSREGLRPSPPSSGARRGPHSLLAALGRALCARRLLVRTAVFALVMFSAPALGADAPTQHEIEESLTCQCGCGLTVHSCNHLQCPSGDPIKKEIAERLARGEDKETILQAFRQRYGEKVLSSPTFRGFNWFAWITPFAVVLTGGLVMSLVIRRWVRAPRAPAVSSPSLATSDDPLRRRLARELEEFDREPDPKP